MEISLLQIIVISSLCALTAFIAHIGVAVFHDGVRPITPEYIEGRMKRKELGSIAFGLSIGFIASVGVAQTIATEMFNPWILFLPTDILGIIAPKKWLALMFGAVWGGIVVTSLTLISKLLTPLPIDIIGSMKHVAFPVAAGLALFPIVAIFYHFGRKKGFLSLVVVLFFRQLVSVYTTIYPELIEIFIGIVLLIMFTLIKDFKNKSWCDTNKDLGFGKSIVKIRKNVFYLALVGAAIGIASNLHFFAGSEVSIYTISSALKETNSALSDGLIKQAAFAEFIRAVSFVPLIVTTAIATGVYGVAGLTFIYPIAYLSPNWMVAGVLGALVTCVEILLLNRIGKILEKFPSIRDLSDSIRSTMTMVMEFSLLIGSVMAIISMGGYTGFFIGVAIYFANESMGKPIMKLAIGPVIVIVTGLALNILYYLGLFVPIAS